MSRHIGHRGYYVGRYSRDPRDPRNQRESRDLRERRDQHRDDRGRGEYRSYDKQRHSSRKSPSKSTQDRERSRSRSPRKEKDVLDDNILSEISKLPEPSEMWDNQFQDNNFPPPLTPFGQENVANPAAYPPNFQAQGVYANLYDDFPPAISASLPPAQPPAPEWNQLSLPPPPAASTASFIPNIEDQMKKEAAIESEMRHQKAALSKQREDYIKKSGILKKELDTLKDQRNELRGDTKRSPSPDTKRFLKENTKLQLEIQNKLKTINNVVDMLNGIIGEDAPPPSADCRDSDDSGDRTTKRKSRSPSGKKANYVYYDPEMHWCRVCNEFPPTAKDYLNHLHSPSHSKMAAAHMEAPWHSVTGLNEGFPSNPSAPTKRTPIRGLQFFVPSTAWYCKLCDQFIGDLHCASAHLKSIVHSKNYGNFVEQNPHWETDWMSDRQRAVEKARSKPRPPPSPAATAAAAPPPAAAAAATSYASHTITFHKDGFHTKSTKDSPPSVSKEAKKKKDKKKKTKKRKKSSSSSDSSESSSGESEPVKIKKKKKPEPDDKSSLSEWIHSNRLTDNDRKLLNSIKTKIKQEKHDKDDKRRSQERSVRDRERERSIAEMQRKIRESERGSPPRRSPSRRSESRRSESRRSESRRSESRRAASRQRSPSQSRDKKPEIRKMPFIGKMPVFKSLNKNIKSEDAKKEDEKKKEEDEAAKKRREEMDAEIQKKVAEFKEKIARAQQERELVTLGAPTLALPTELGGALPPPIVLPPPPPAPPAPAPAPAAAPAPSLPKDFQEALDIIFPTDANKAQELAQDIFSSLPPIPGFPSSLLPGMSPFPPLMPQMNPFMGFDLNAPLFQPRPQLYDAHVPMVTNRKRPNKQMRNNNKGNFKKPTNAKNTRNNQNNAQKLQPDKNGTAEKNKEEMDDLAMLGMDASDVGAG